MVLGKVESLINWIEIMVLGKLAALIVNRRCLRLILDFLDFTNYNFTTGNVVLNMAVHMEQRRSQYGSQSWSPWCGAQSWFPPSWSPYVFHPIWWVVDFQLVCSVSFPSVYINTHRNLSIKSYNIIAVEILMFFVVSFMFLRYIESPCSKNR